MAKKKIDKTGEIQYHDSVYTGKAMNWILPELTCCKCNHQWMPRDNKPPQRCPKCGNSRWDSGEPKRGSPECQKKLN